jgi:hypothetical protein
MAVFDNYRASTFRVMQKKKPPYDRAAYTNLNFSGQDTVNFPLLAVPPGVVTAMFPVLAPCRHGGGDLRSRIHRVAGRFDSSESDRRQVADLGIVPARPRPERFRTRPLSAKTRR